MKYPIRLSVRQRFFLSYLLSSNLTDEVEEYVIKAALETGEYNQGQKMLFLALRERFIIFSTAEGFINETN